MSTSDQTEIMDPRGASQDQPLPANTVLGERYEIREAVSRDGLSRSYLAFDQEQEGPVLLRHLRPDLLSPGKALTAVRERLRAVLGIGGRFLSGPIDADVEDGGLYVVEPLPTGVPLSAVMRRRRADDRVFGAKEVLPVVAQVGAALAAIPPPFAHLEVNPRQIWIDPEGLQLTGAFLLGALPEPARARVLERDENLAAMAAPELLSGQAGDAADRYSVGKLAMAMLVPEGEEPSALTLGPVAEALEHLLREDLGARATSVDLLCEGLARLGGVPVPELDPGAYRRPRPRRRPSRAPAPQPDSGKIDPRLLRAARAADAEHEIDPRLLRAARAPVEPRPKTFTGRRIPGAAEGGTQEISLDQILEEAPVEDLDGLDPRLVRAALDMELEEEPSTPAPAPPTRREPTQEITVDQIVDAAPRGPGVAPREPTQEITADQIVDAVPSRSDMDGISPDLLAAVRAGKRGAAAAPATAKGPAPSARPDLSDPGAPAAKASPRPAPKKKPSRGAPDTEELTLEDLVEAPVRPAVKPVPRPRRASSPGLAAAGPALFDDSRSLPALDEEMLARLPRGAGAGRRGGRSSGVMMLAAVLLGLLILASSLGYYAYRRRTQQQERQERLDQRYRQLQDEANPDGTGSAETP